MRASLNVVVVGGVACGPKTASRLKRLVPEANITLIEKGDLLSYGACGLPYFVEGFFSDINQLINTAAGAPRTPAYFESVKGVAVRHLCEAVKIHREKKLLEVKNLEDNTTNFLPYDKLVLAVGGSPVRPPVPGLDLANVWFMTHPKDAESLPREAKRQALAKAVIVGGGFIGIEMAEALKALGMQVTVVEMMPQVMPGVLDADMALLAENHLKEKGVHLALGEKVTALEGEDRVTGVQTDSRLLPADLVLVAVGTRPNTDLAKAAGLTCGKGISVNSFGQTSDPDIYAGGDCADSLSLQPENPNSLYVPLGSTANKMGRIIANHIAGFETPFGGISGTAVVKAFDFTLARTGLGMKQAEALGLDVETILAPGIDRPHYMPGSAKIHIKIMADRKTRKVLGIQIVGSGEVSKRLDVAAATIRFGGTLDQLADIDFGYAPPFGPPIDPLAAAAQVLSNKLDGIAQSVSAAEAKTRIEKGTAAILDVRSAAEIRAVRLPCDFIHIPLGEIRTRHGELPRDRDILVICGISARAYEAQRILNAAGFTQVRFIEGGISAWPYSLAKQ